MPADLDSVIETNREVRVEAADRKVGKLACD